MVIYEINALVDESLAAEFETYMTTRHIPDLMATGYFLSAVLGRSGDTFQFRYKAADHASLDGYLRDHAQRLRADVAKHFPTGTQFTRQVWDVIGEFPTS